MPDREKVIKGLECCIIHVSCAADGGCPYRSQTDANANCLDTAIKDAIALLKAQVPVEPTWRRGIPFCGKCGRQFGHGFKYCPDCGRAVKWQ